jgi:hypothetical protein
MSAEQARESLVETLDVTSGQIEDKTMTVGMYRRLLVQMIASDAACPSLACPVTMMGHLLAGVDEHLLPLIKECDPAEPTFRPLGARVPDDGVNRITTPDTLKMVREALCVAQHGLGYLHDRNADRHRELLGRLIEGIDQQRPLGPDGKHGHLHTITCGCEDKPTGWTTFAKPTEENEA